MGGADTTNGGRAALQRALQAAGGGGKLAAQLQPRITRQAVYQWRRVPWYYVDQVARITGVPAHELRPDLYPATETAPEAAPAPAAE